MTGELRVGIRIALEYFIDWLYNDIYNMSRSLIQHARETVALLAQVACMPMTIIKNEHIPFTVMSREKMCRNFYHTC